MVGALVAVVFILAATSKLRAPRRFAQELGDYKILPQFALLPVALLLPLLELASGVGYFVADLRLLSACVMLALLLLFSSAVLLNLLQGRRSIRCACFGRDDQLLGWSTLVRNGLLALAALGSIFASAGSGDFTSFAGLVGCLLALAIGVLIFTEAQVLEAMGAPNE